MARPYAEKLNINWEKDYLLWLAIFTMVFALGMPDREDLFKNYWHLLTHQTYLIHDFFKVAGLSATFANVALHFGVAYYLNIRNNLTHLTGFQLAAIGIFVGHSLFGTHLLNILPIIAGVILYAKWSSQSFKLYTTISLFATATAPLVSYLVFANGLSLGSMLLGLGFGLLVGFITPPLAEEFLKFHHGYTLYNIGFTTGIISLMVYAGLAYFGIDIPKVSLVSSQAGVYLRIYFLILCLTMIGFALYGADPEEIKVKFTKLTHRVGRLPDDFVFKYGRRTAFLNMGLMGLVYLGLIHFLGIPLSGPVAGGIFSIIGFSGFGKHLRNTLPVAVGVLMAGHFSGQGMDELSFALSLLFGTALAPIAGYYGLLAGLLAGFLQYNVTKTVLNLHLGLNLYNNGFASGFVAGFLVPILDVFHSRLPWSKNSKGVK